MKSAAKAGDAATRGASNSAKIAKRRMLERVFMPPSPWRSAISLTAPYLPRDVGLGF
jgi:hypothetical protein